MAEVSIPFINSLIVLDGDGDRLLAKYYDGRKKSDQLKFELLLQKKTKSMSSRTDVEILPIDQELVVFKSGSDCKFFVTGPMEENDLILVGVLEAIFETVASLLKGMVEKRAMLENLELVLLSIDEVVDHGHVMELDPSAVVGRVLMRGGDSSSSSSSSSQPSTIGDLTISQALGLAREQFMRSLSSGRGDGY